MTDLLQVLQGKGFSLRDHLDGYVGRVGAGVPDGRLMATTTLEARPQSARAARHFVEGLLREWHREHVADLVTLLTSEIVTNAVMHARSVLDLKVDCLHDCVRVCVHDRGEGVPVRRHVSIEAASGRGLALVDTLASRWGVDPEPPGKTVWFEVSA
jgi:anti-sigma regulatory factor (Ser/Thr protein kinase)